MTERCDTRLLHAVVQGEGPPLLFLHGFTGSVDSWRRIVPLVSGGFRTFCIDLIGHAASPAPVDGDRYSMAGAVVDIEHLLDRHEIRSAIVIGYSLGGRVGLHFALARPERVSALVLESATYGIADPEERRKRRADDRSLAEWIETHGVRAFAERWERHPLFASQAALPEHVRAEQRRERLRHSSVGLANSLRGMGTGAQDSLRERLHEINCPTLLLAGELDVKFSKVACEMSERIPGSKVRLLSGAGHNTHLERPLDFAAEVRTFLTTITKK